MQSAPSSPHLLELPARRAVWTLAWPTIALGLLRTSYFLANSFWVSGLGREALAAIGGSAFAIWIVYSLTELAATGVYSAVAQAVGARKPDRARQALGDGLVLALILGGVVAITLYELRSPYFELLSLTEGLERTQGLEFLAMSAVGVPTMTVFNTLISAFRATGDTRIALWIFGATLLVNLALDPFLIFGYSGWSGFGIGGAALATAMANFLGIILSLRRLTVMGYRPRIQALERRRLVHLVTIGLPIAASGTGFSLVYVLLGREINRFGPASMAAVGLGHRIESLGYLACVGFQVAATTLVGQWVGAGQPGKAVEAARQVRRQMFRLLLPVSLVVTLLAPLFIYPFSTDPEVMTYGTWYLRCNGAVMVFMGLEVVYEGAFTGTGRTLPALLIAFPLTAARIPLSHLLAVQLSMGPAGIWLAIALTTVAKGVLMSACFAPPGWRRGASTASV